MPSAKAAKTNICPLNSGFSLITVIPAWPTSAMVLPPMMLMIAIRTPATNPITPTSVINFF